ncbi:MAG: transglutaminase-like domain-containing protein [Acidimicrobiales bacterium]
MDAFTRFAELMRQPGAKVARSACPLDEACLLIAAHLHPDVDVDAQRARIDDLAAIVGERTVAGVGEALFGRVGFRGDTESYRHPDNSLLHRVLDRRRGIPITLSVLMIEVGRRIGVELVGIGLPGHFLVGDANDDDAFVDPFAAGVRLDRRGCQRLLERIHGQGVALEPAHLRPTPPAMILARVLQNMRVSYAAAGPRALLVEVLRLRTVVPGVPLAERRVLADVLTRAGQFDQAATELETVALRTLGPDGDQLRTQAHRLRARLN